MRKIKHIYFVCLLIIVNLASIQNSFAQACFKAVTNYAVGTAPRDICSADFNKDGILDLAVANYSSRDISVLLGDGLGGFGAPTNISSPTTYSPMSIVSADFNNDGNPDLAINGGSITGKAILIYLGTGTGSFGAYTNVGSFSVLGGGYTPAPICVADFNNDGNIDIAGTAYGSSASQMLVLLGDGVGGFTNGTPPSIMAYNVIGISSTDLNYDNNSDIVISNGSSTNNITVFLGDGLGGFGAGSNFSAGTQPNAALGADFNSDGIKDMVVANYGSANVSLLIGNGSGSFGAATNFAVGTNPGFLTVGDFNLDGQNDLAVSNYGSSNISVLIGDGAGGFANAINFSVGASPMGIINSDFNADGIPDIAVANYSSNNSSILLNNLPKVSVNSKTICAGQSTCLTASGANSYVWSTGATTATLCVTPAVNTTYTVTGTNSPGCTRSTTVSVTIGSVITVSVNSPTICYGLTAALTASDAITYVWSTGSTSTTINVTPTTTTTYTVTGTAGSCTGLVTGVVTVNPNPTLSISPASTICSGSSKILTVSGASGYSWSTGATTTTTTVVPATTITYTVTGTNTMGCTATITAKITVNPIPTVTVNSATICNGLSTTLTANGASTYSWSGGGAGSTKGVTPAVTTTYTVTGTSANGCTSTATSVVTVNPLPTLSVSSASTICSGSSKILTVGGASTYNWSTGATTTTITVTPASTTTYTVTGTSSAGCTSTTIAVVTIGGSTMIITASSATVCKGIGTCVTASGATTYSWSTGATTTTLCVTPVSTTTYTVTGTTGGCTGTAISTVTISSLPTVTVNSANICAGSGACLNAAGGGLILGQREQQLLHFVLRQQQQQPIQ